MGDLVAWLRAQLDYTRLLGESLQALGAPRSPLPAETATLLAGAGDLLVAEAASRRRLLGLLPFDSWAAEDWSEPMWELARLLALPYADRPGYRDEWRPEVADG